MRKLCRIGMKKKKIIVTKNKIFKNEKKEENLTVDFPKTSTVLIYFCIAAKGRSDLSFAFLKEEKLREELVAGNRNCYSW